MSLSIGEAPEQVELEPGRGYSCQVKGYWVELRVLPPGVDPKSVVDESDIMLDPWVELPEPTPTMTVVGEYGPLPPPDIPEMPTDWEES
jgi:hypothetical protein